LTKEGHQDRYVGISLHVVDYMRINRNEDAREKHMLYAREPKYSFAGECLNRNREPGRVVGQEDATPQLDQHQLPPLVGKKDLYFSVFAYANVMRQDDCLTHNYASFLDFPCVVFPHSFSCNLLTFCALAL
jgi:hypothetical protein